MEREHFCQFDNFEWMRPAPYVPLRGNNHELRASSLEPRHQGMCSKLMNVGIAPISSSRSALAAFHHASVSLWRGLINAVLPHDIVNAAVL